MRVLVLCLVFLSACSIIKPNMPLPEKINNNFQALKTNYQELDPQYKKLLDSAETAMSNSYSPYHKFMVGSALLSEDGKIIVGTNVENAAGTSICAERSAIVSANAQGIKKISAIAIIGKGHAFDSEDVIAPCGACRQVIYESSRISGKNTVVIMSNTKKDRIILSTIEDLLPMAFGPSMLQ
jgi:cytidine deaminase